MEKPLMCRICLAIGVRMHSIVMTQLQEIYEYLSMTPLETVDNRPLQVCYICFEKLKNCYRLRQTCIQSEELLTQMYNSNLFDPAKLLQNSCKLKTMSVSHVDIESVVQPNTASDMDIQLTENLIQIKIEPTDSEDFDKDHLEEDAYLSSRSDDDVSLAVVKKEQCDFTSGAPIPIEFCMATLDTHNVAASSDLDKSKQNENTKSKGKGNKTNKPPDYIRTRDNTVNRGKFQCEVCPKRFERKSKLEIHNRIHTGEKPYECDVCHRCFNVKGSYNKHIRIHTGEKPYKCEICEKRFSDNSAYKKHLRVHTGEKPYQCDMCQKRFSDNKAFRKHVRTRACEKPFKCDVCMKAFGDTVSLRTHFRIHTGEKPYQCHLCPKVFNRRNNLKSHVRTHTGDKPYQCSVCKKRFIQMSNLKRHIRSHTGEKPFECSICNKSFIQKGSLKIHYRTHTAVEPEKES